MKVVLTRDVKNTGRANEVVEVSDGHALNFLIPKRYAVAATPGALKSAESRKGATEARRATEFSQIAERMTALKETKSTLTKKANEQGHLYDAVDAEAIAAVTGIPEEVIMLERSIKEIGTHEIPVAFGETADTFSIEIVAE